MVSLTVSWKQSSPRTSKISKVGVDLASLNVTYHTDAFDMLRKEHPGFPEVKLTFIVVGKRFVWCLLHPEVDIVQSPYGVLSESFRQPVLANDYRYSSLIYCSSKDRTGNLRAGFVTVEGLVNPTFNDFYLQSHAAVKGSRCIFFSAL